MTDYRINHLDPYLARQEPLVLPRALLNLIAQRLEEALADPRMQPLAELSEQLNELASHGASLVTAELMEEIRSASTEGPLASAYSLGQIIFAQTVAAIAADKRVDDEFLEALKSDAGRKLAAALLDSDVSSGDLAQMLEERPETISRRLGRFRELGICDYRKDGTTVYNFLTPAARALAEAMNLRGSGIPKPNKKATYYLGSAFDDLDEMWKKTPNFASSEPLDDTCQRDPVEEMTAGR